MSAPRAAGPSGEAAWESMQAGTGSEQPALSLLLLPDVLADVRYALLAAPAVARNGQGAPVFSLTLLLQREPLPHESAIGPLIVSGTLSMEISCSVPPASLPALSASVGAEVRPVFARSASIALDTQIGAPRALAQGQASGTQVRAALSASLNREEALDVLGAIDGAPSRLVLRATVSFRTGASWSRLRVAGSWAAVYDFIAVRTDLSGEIDAAALRLAFDAMVREGIVRVDASPPGPMGTAGMLPLDALFNGFSRLIPVIAQRSDDGRLRLKSRPPQGYGFEYDADAPATAERTVDLRADLAQALGGLLDGWPRDAYVRIVCPGSQSPDGGLAQPRRIRSSPTRGPDGTASRMRMSAMNDRVTSIARAMRPASAAFNASVLAHSDFAALHPLQPSSGRITHHWINDAVLDTLRPQDARKLPVIDDPAAPVWRDRVQPNVYWYAPELTLLRPAPADNPGSSPYVFTYRRTGATADGRPALSGSVRFTLRTGRSAATDAALKRIGNAQGMPLPLAGLAVSLAIPYVDQRDGTTKFTTYAAQTAQNGDAITATVPLLNDAVRLAYGALAVPGFQARAARLEIAYSYEGYVVLDAASLSVVAGGKTAVTAIARTAAEAHALAGQPHLDMTTGRFRYAAGEVRLVREKRRDVEIPAPEVALAHERAGGAAVAMAAHSPASVSLAHSSALAGSAAAVHVSPINAVAIARPPISASASLLDLLRKTRYAARTFVRNERIDASFPCEQLGAFYRREADDGVEATGCVDALKLGEAVVRQYGEIGELATASYRVFRSLQQPGRFLVLPAAYRITRYGPDIADKAYRPAITVYSAIDLETPQNNRVVYQATLQPDIPLDARRALRAALTAQAAAPVIEYPTEIAGDFEYTWTIGAMVHVEPGTVKAPDGFQVALATDLAGALMLGTMVQNTGVAGSARLRLTDGTALDTTLSVDLKSIVGPWSSGPVELARTGSGARLTNRIERPVEVSDVQVYRDGRAMETVKVETVLAAGASCGVAIADGYAEAYAVCSVPAGTPATLDEIRTFVENIHANVVFVDLVNYANHDLIGLEVEAQLKDVPGTHSVIMAGDPAHGEVDFLLPITKYLASHKLLFSVKKTYHNTAPDATGWLEWDLESDGNVVSLTWDMIK